MTSRWGGASKRALRASSNRGDGDDHLFEMEGAVRLTLFVPPNHRMKGYRELRTELEALGCQVVFPSSAPAALRESPGPRFRAINIEALDGIPDQALRAAHRWAHKRDLLHSFMRYL